MAYFLAALLISAAAGFSAHYLATKKRRAVKPWVVSSVFFFLPVFLLALLPARKEQNTLLNGT